MQSLISLFVVVLMAFAEAKSIRDEPKFCHGLECPHFITVNKTDKYELRCYKEDYKWASTIVAGTIFYIFPPKFQLYYYVMFLLRCCVTQSHGVTSLSICTERYGFTLLKYFIYDCLSSLISEISF